MTTPGELAEPAARLLRERGFVAIEPALGAAQLADARAATDRILAGHGAVSEYGRIALDAWRREAVFHEMLPVLAAWARGLLGQPEVVVFQDLVIDKPASATSWIPYHQDQAYLPLDRDDGLVAWLALDDAGLDAGCLHYVPGTQRLGPRRPAHFQGGTDRDAHLPPIEVGDRAVVPMPAPAGLALFHDPMVWHGSPPNPSGRPRRAWSIYFLPPQVRWAPERAVHPYLRELDPAPGSPVEGPRFPRF